MLLASGFTTTAVLAAASNKGNPIATFLPLLLILLVGYFFLVRPARVRQREAVNVRSRLVPGAEVQTTAGMFATVAEVNDDGTVVLEIAPGVRCRYLSAAVARVIPPPVPDDASELTDTPEGGDGATSS